MTSERRFILLIMQAERLVERGVIDRFSFDYEEDENGDILYFDFVLEKGDKNDKENYRRLGFSDIAFFDEIRANGDLEGFYFA